MLTKLCRETRDSDSLDKQVGTVGGEKQLDSENILKVMGQKNCADVLDMECIYNEWSLNYPFTTSRCRLLHLSRVFLIL